MKKFFLLILLAAALPVRAELRVFACEPEWAALAQALGGDKVTVYSATHALQDPHRIEARPSLIARARNAQLVVCTGAELEAGWLPSVLREAGSAGVQPGVAMQCLTPRAAAKAASKRPTMPQVRPLSTTSCRYRAALGPIRRGKGLGNRPLRWAIAAAP